MCYLTVPSCVPVRIFFKGLESEPAVSMETQAFTWNLPLPCLAASLPEAVPVLVTLGAGTLCTSTIVTPFPSLRIAPAT